MKSEEKQYLNDLLLCSPNVWNLYVEINNVLQKYYSSVETHRQTEKESKNMIQLAFIFKP